VFLRSIVTTGSSGQPLSRFYSNQTLLWSANGHISMLRTVPVGPAVSSLTELEPRGE
jgi:acyl-homoserine lactone acylase PvdQ